jgi:CheY-like chemotaxis protein
MRYSCGHPAVRLITQMYILVVDDHVLIREALRGVLKELKGDATVLEAADYRRAMERLEEHPDVGLILEVAPQFQTVR